jgi:hypothetical protein
VIPAGGNVSGTNGSVSYSLGQIMVTMIDGAQGSIAHGVQQPHEISVVTGITDSNEILLVLSAYPNPTTDNIQIKIEAGVFKDLCFQLLDIQGRLLDNDRIIKNETSISMNNLLPSTYLLKIMEGTKEVKVFKIIKH